MLGALLLAWLCANRPQPLAYAVADWFRGAAHFSHQAQLADEVRALVAASPHVSAAKSAAIAAAPEAVKPAPLCPESSLLKRPEWSLGEKLVVAPPSVSSASFAPPPARVPAEIPDDVPHPPPRAGAIA